MTETRVDENGRPAPPPPHAPPHTEESIQLLVDQVRDYAIFTLDTQGRIATWNAGAQQLEGYREEEILGQAFECFYTEADRAEGKPDHQLRRAREEGRVEDECWWVRKDGSRFWADAVLSAIRDESGTLRGFAKVTRDVTERRQLGFLREASAVLGSSLDVSETLPAVARRSVPFLADWVAVHRCERGEMFPVALAHADPEKVRRAESLGDRFPLSAQVRAIQTVVRSGRAALFSEPTEAWIPEGLEEEARAFGLRATMVVPLVVDGRVLGAMCFANAESDHRFTKEELAFVEELGARCARALENARVHEALRREHELLDTVVRQMPEGVIVFEEGGQLLVANGEAKRMLGPEGVEETREGEPPPLFRNGEPVPRETRPFARALRGEEVHDEDFELGQQEPARTISVNAVPVRIASGRMAGAVVTFQDVTERRRETDERARQAYFRERFIGILGHDLRNPLSAILGSAHLLLRKGLPEQHARALGRIASSADRMAKMISDVLDLTRVRMGGGIPVAPRRVDLHDVARRVVDELEIAHPERSVRFTSRDDTWAEVDPDRIAQVFSNLVSNAIQHGDPGEVSVTLQGMGEEVWFEVHNGGDPIPSEIMAELFEPFRRETGTSRKRSAHGLGLGLFIAKELVTAHGGKLEVESTREAGTTFRLGLPRVFPAGLPRDVP